jgi:DNA-binding response OmpR family regulator
VQTALVVDDDRFFLAVLGDFVSHHLQMRPILVEDGTAALDIIESEHVDLVLLDIVMPGIDGLEVLGKIKDRHPSLPVIMVTSSSSVDHVIGALRAGADDFVRKPVNLEELQLGVGRVMHKVRVAKLPPPPPRDEASERRRADRVRLPARSRAQLQLLDVILIDLSISGALIEHTQPVRPGEIYRFAFSVDGHQVQVLARAMRVFASHRVAVTGGERQVVYRSGVEFVGVEKGVAEVISSYIDGLQHVGPEQAAD